MSGSKALRRGGALLLASSLSALAVGGAGSRQPARAATPELGNFSLTATAPAVEITEDSPSATTHPEGQGTVPMTSTTLSTGPIGYALSSVFWPGPLAGNAGSLASLLAPTSVQGVPVPDAVQQSLYPNLTAANYPVRAEARSGSQPDGKFNAPGTSLTAHADNHLVKADAKVDVADPPGVAKYGTSESHSSSKLSPDNTIGEATAATSVSNIDFAGVIKIGNISSDAAAKTDGTKATASGHMTITDMTIGGQKASIDEKGLRIGDSSQPLNAVANQVAAQALTGGGFQVFVSSPRVEIKGPAASYSAGSLIIFWKPPGSQNEFTYVFGNSRVAVTGAVGDPSLSALNDGASSDSFFAPAPTTTPSATPAATGSRTSPASVATPIDSSAPVSSGEVAAAPVAAPAAEGAAVPTTPVSSNSPSPSSGLPAGWVLAGLAGAGLLAAGFRRATDDILERAATACPLES